MQRRTTTERARRRADLQRTSLRTGWASIISVSPQWIYPSGYMGSTFQCLMVSAMAGVRARQPCLLSLGPPFLLLGLGLMCH